MNNLSKIEESFDKAYQLLDVLEDELSYKVLEEGSLCEYLFQVELIKSYMREISKEF